MVTSSEAAAPPQQDSLLKNIRNMWEFASFFEWYLLFGEAVKLPELDIEVCSLHLISSS